MVGLASHRFVAPVLSIPSQYLIMNFGMAGTYSTLWIYSQTVDIGFAMQLDSNPLT